MCKVRDISIFFLFETDITSVPRFCALGTACDMFFVDMRSGINCFYFPHLALKTFNMMDMIVYTGEKRVDMYMMQCAQGIPI